MDNRQTHKFEKLEVWQRALTLQTTIYKIADKLPEMEKFNLRTQMVRACSSVGLNIAEGSTSGSDKVTVSRLLSF